MPILKPFLIILALLLVLPCADALEAGGSAYTKKQSTSLLSAPQRDASPTSTLPFATKVKITSIQGVWVQVSADGKSGWIFNGNLSDDKPAAENKSTLTTTAADTTAATAARPLSKASKDYASRKGESAAAADVEWVEKVSDSVSASAVRAYMKENGKGEYSK